MVFQAEDRARAKKQHAEQAIQLALQGRWTEAAQLNREIVETFPNDVDAFNRLGKAMTELGHYGEAKDAYMKALDIDPLNSIARKNLTRLATLGEEKAAPRPAGSLVIQSMAGEYVGEVERRLSQRLIKLMEGGNEYIAAISALDDKEVRLFIRETFQHSSQTGKLSFPPTVTETFRPYVKGRLLHRDADDDEAYFDEGDERDEWAGGEEAEETEGTIREFRLGADDAGIAVEDTDEDEE